MSRHSFRWPSAVLAVWVAVVGFSPGEARANDPRHESSGSASGATAKRPGESTARGLPPESRWDWITLGAGGGLPWAFSVQLGTYLGSRFRVTGLELTHTFTLLGEQTTFDWFIGPTFGVGGHHGRRNRFSHWFVTGIWFGQMHPIILFAPQVAYSGLFLMVGYEFRWHFGRRLDWVVGLRLFGVGSPRVGKNVWSGCDCTGQFLCNCDRDPEDEVRVPVTMGLMVLFGF